MTENKATVAVIGAEEMPTEVLASAIVKLSQASEKMQRDGMNRLGLLVLLKHATGLHMKHIGAVLDALPKLAATYTIPKKPTNQPPRRTR